MSLHHIELHQFKRHSHLSADFGAGLTGITGNNFAGKSTLLKGILFALFGVSATGHKSERLATRGSDGTAKATVTMTLPNRGKVKIERTLKGAKAWSDDGTLLANGTTPVTKLVEEAYGMSAADLQLLLYSKQGQSQALLEFGAAALQQTVERLAKTDLVDKVLSLITSDLSRIEGELAGLGPAGDAKAIKEELDHWSMQTAGYEASLNDLKETISKTRVNEGSLKAKYEAANELTLKRQEVESKLEFCRTRMAELTASIQETNTTLAGFPEDVELLVDSESANLDSLQRTWTSRRSRSDSAESCVIRIDALAKQITQCELDLSQSNEVAGELVIAEQTLQELQEQNQAETTKVNHAYLALEEARKAVDEGVCRECKRPFSAEEQKAAVDRMESAATEYDNLYASWSAIQTPLSLAVKKVEELKQLFRPGCAELLASAKEAMSAAEAELATHLNGFDSVAALKAAAEESREQMDITKSRWADLSKMCERKRSLEKTKEVLDSQLSVAGLDEIAFHADLSVLGKPADITGLKLEMQETQRQLISLHEVEVRALAELSDSKAKVDQYRREFSAAEAIGVKRMELEGSISTRKRLQTWLRKSRSELMSELWDGMLNYASYLISTTTSGELSKVYRQDSELTVDERGEAVPVTELSGFQRSLVGLALRIAMSRVFYGGDHMLLLDEPTADANDENAARVAGMLQSLGSQVIFVSHREGDSANAGTIIRL